MDYYTGLLPLSESENDMADKGIIIEKPLPVVVTFHKPLSFKLSTYHLVPDLDLEIRGGRGGPIT